MSFKAFAILHDTAGAPTVAVAIAAITALRRDFASRPHLRAIATAGEPPELRRAALLALAGSPADLPILRHGATAAEAQVRAAAIAGLSDDPLAFPLLLAMLDADPSSAVRAAAIDALARAAWGRPRILRLAREANLRNFGSLIHAPRSEPATFEFEASLYRALADDPAITTHLGPHLVALASDVRDLLLANLTALPDHRPFVRSMLASDEPLLRASAARALARDPASITDILHLTRDPSAVVRAAVVAVLGVDARSVAAREERFTDVAEKDAVRVALLETMQPGEETHARALLSSPSPILRGVAALALLRDTPSVLERRALLIDASAFTRAHAIQSLARDEGSRAAIEQALGDPDPWVRRAAILALAAHPSASVLICVHLDAPPPVGPAAAEALRDDPAALPRLRARITLARAAERRRRLADLATAPDGEREVRALLAHDDLAVRAAAAEALRDAGLDARPAPPDPSVLDQPSSMDGDPIQLAAVRAIAGNPEHRSRLRHIVASGEYSADVTAIALSAINPEDADPDALLALLDDRHELDILRLPVARLLSAQGTHEAALRACLDDPSPALRALLVTLLAPHALTSEALRDRLRDRDPRVRAAAAEALTARTPRDPGAPIAAHPDLVRLARDATLAQGTLAPFPLPGEETVDLTDHPDLNAVLAWLTARLVADEHGHTLAPQAELAPSARQGTHLVRLPFDQDHAPANARVFPAHNLLEAAAIARRLVMKSAPVIGLACAEVAFSDLTLPDLAPGAIFCGPTFFALRLACPESPTGQQ